LGAEEARNSKKCVNKSASSLKKMLSKKVSLTVVVIQKCPFGNSKKGSVTHTNGILN